MNTDKIILLLLCAGFSFFTALIKHLHDTRGHPKSIYVFMIDVFLSAVSGLITALLSSSIIEDDITLIGISGAGGILGMSGLKLLMQIKLGKKVKISLKDSNNDNSNKSKK
jgi:hypothetical protein